VTTDHDDAPNPLFAWLAGNSHVCPSCGTNMRVGNTVPTPADTCPLGCPNE
jgi:hypothetical protein